MHHHNLHPRGRCRCTLPPRRWESSGYFKPDEAAAGEPYVISMPPPNVTGKLHMGHAMFATLQVRAGRAGLPLCARCAQRPQPHTTPGYMTQLATGCAGSWQLQGSHAPTPGPEHLAALQSAWLPAASPPGPAGYHGAVPAHARPAHPVAARHW